MATVIFYEKPGCINNVRQKKILINSGHKVISYNLLREAWTAAKLRLFFQGLPVSDWFNTSAPEIKSGQIQPDRLDENQALDNMISNPVLIRRPLMQVYDQYSVGFDLKTVHNWIGLSFLDSSQDVETCQQG